MASVQPAMTWMQGGGRERGGKRGKRQRQKRRRGGKGDDKHACLALSPSLSKRHTYLVGRKLGGLATVVAGVELCAVDECALVVAVARCARQGAGCPVGSTLQNLVLEPTSQNGHAFLVGVSGKEGHAFGVGGRDGAGQKG
jgi:hypothetical protein